MQASSIALQKTNCHSAWRALAEEFAPVLVSASPFPPHWARQCWMVRPTSRVGICGTCTTMICRRFLTAPQRHSRRRRRSSVSRYPRGVDSVVLRGRFGPFAARSFRRTDAMAFSSSNPDRWAALGFVVSSAFSIRSALRSTSDLSTARRSCSSSSSFKVVSPALGEALAVMGVR